MIAPGDLVFSRWRSPPCASDYEVDIVKGEARLSGGFDTWTGMALVVAVIAPEAKGLCGTGLICLFLPKSQRFVFTWASSAWEGPP